ncbi:Rho termination factor N-terminal domain-containing protein, partial [Xanthomonas campestris pv. nigromaculans]|nr:Rho termination factor N-terminal domain-containing protein [Xanthomonas campestris pv. nigromaculans]
MSDHPSSDTGSSVDAPVEKRVRKPRVSKTAAATEEAGAQQPNLPLPTSPAPEAPRAPQAPSRAADPAPAQTSSDGAHAGQAPSASHGGDTHGEPSEGGQSQQQRFNQAQQQQNQNQGQNQGQGQQQGQNQNQNAGQNQQGQGGQGQGQNQQGQNQQGNRRDRFRNRRDRGPRDRFGNDGGMPSSDGNNEPFIARPHPAVPEGFPVYSLSDLKRMPAQKLLDIADQLNIQEGVARARKQDVIFALLKVLTR